MREIVMNEARAQRPRLAVTANTRRSFNASTQAVRFRPQTLAHASGGPFVKREGGISRDHVERALNIRRGYGPQDYDRFRTLFNKGSR